MEKGKYPSAFNSLCRLRKHKIQAARDMYYAYKLLEVETAERQGRNAFKEFFFVRRNRRAAQSAFFVMFMQQFCGVNVRTARSYQSVHESLTTSPGYRILQHLYLQRSRLLNARGFARVHGYWHNKLPFCNPSYLHDRYIRSKEPSAYDVPTYGHLPPLVRTVFLPSREPR
jgi:hypothetical protein